MIPQLLPRLRLSITLPDQDGCAVFRIFWFHFCALGRSADALSMVIHVNGVNATKGCDKTRISDELGSTTGRVIKAPVQERPH